MAIPPVVFARPLDFTDKLYHTFAMAKAPVNGSDYATINRGTCIPVSNQTIKQACAKQMSHKYQSYIHQAFTPTVVRSTIEQSTII
eukprot:11209838-Lingulodinium_polyedra.AAC.1